MNFLTSIIPVRNKEVRHIAASLVTGTGAHPKSRPSPDPEPRVHATPTSQGAGALSRGVRALTCGQHTPGFVLQGELHL